MTTALEGGEGSASHPGRSLPPGKTRYPLYRSLGGPQGRSEQVRKISPPPPGFDPRTVQPVACRYTDYATRPTDRNKVEFKSPFWEGLFTRIYVCAAWQYTVYILQRTEHCHCRDLPWQVFHCVLNRSLFHSSRELFLVITNSNVFLIFYSLVCEEAILYHLCRLETRWVSRFRIITYAALLVYKTSANFLARLNTHVLVLDWNKWIRKRAIASEVSRRNWDAKTVYAVNWTQWSWR